MPEQQPQPHEAAAPAAAAETATEPQLRPRIYVASLSDYNAGRLHGTWLDADQEPAALQAGIQSMLASSPEPVAEDWAIHDYEDFAGLCVDDFETLGNVSRLARGLTAHGPAFAGLVELVGAEAATEEAFAERYLGHWSSTADYAEQLGEACDLTHHLGQLPRCLQPYVQLDAAAFGRDLVVSGEIATYADGAGVHVYLGAGS